MPVVHEGTERVFLGKIADLHTFTTKPTGVPPATGGSGLNVIENIHECFILPSGPGETRVLRFHILEMEVVFDTDTDTETVQVAPFMSRKNPANIEAGGSGGAYDQATDSDADTWGSFGRQTAYVDPLVQAGGNRLRFAVGSARYVAFACATGGSACDAYVYGIVERHGGIS